MSVLSGSKLPMRQLRWVALTLLYFVLATLLLIAAFALVLRIERGSSFGNDWFVGVSGNNWTAFMNAAEIYQTDLNVRKAWITTYVGEDRIRNLYEFNCAKGTLRDVTIHDDGPPPGIVFNSIVTDPENISDPDRVIPNTLKATQLKFACGSAATITARAPEKLPWYVSTKDFSLKMHRRGSFQRH